MSTASSPDIQLKRLKRRIHDIAPRTHGHASPRLPRNNRLHAFAAKAANTARARIAILQLRRGPAARAVNLHRLRALLRDVRARRRRVEHGRGIRGRGERVGVHDVELAAGRVGAVVVRVRDVAREGGVDGGEGLQVGQPRIWGRRCERAIEG